MNENINLCEILKGHEGETFYSKALGYVKLHKIFSNSLIILALKHNRIGFEINVTDAIEDIVPSKNQRDWIKWDKENNKKTPKTWSEYLSQFGIDTEPTLWFDSTKNWGNIGKSCSALFKIHQLIEVGYGGNILPNKYNGRNTFWVILLEGITREFKVYSNNSFKHLVSFNTREQAEEFLKYPENVQLLKDYFMINN